ncbi:MAG: DUF1643 domain-containing protein [Hyphomicrobiales bacterium]|nr:DUF1643 domain-containing protein [Hyphomicrobiales bacterium]
MVRGSAEFGEVRDWQLRFRLDRWWDERPRALVCMANPSHADAERNDPTIRNLLRLSRPLPIGGFTVVNVEPFITSVPADLAEWRRRAVATRPRDYKMIQGKNLRLIRELSATAAVRIVAWGQLVRGKAHAPHLLGALSLDFNEALHAFALTKNGCPKHPLARGRHRIAESGELVLWRHPSLN